MPPEVPLAILVPEATVGVVVLWREASGQISASYRDAADRVPLVRTHAAVILRQLADALDAHAAEMEAPY